MISFIFILTSVFSVGFTASTNIIPSVCPGEFDNVITQGRSIIVGTSGNDKIVIADNKRHFIFTFSGDDCIIANDKSWIFAGSGYDTCKGKKLFHCENILGEEPK